MEEYIRRSRGIKEVEEVEGYIRESRSREVEVWQALREALKKDI